MARAARSRRGNVGDHRDGPAHAAGCPPRHGGRNETGRGGRDHGGPHAGRGGGDHAAPHAGRGGRDHAARGPWRSPGAPLATMAWENAVPDASAQGPRCVSLPPVTAPLEAKRAALRFVVPGGNRGAAALLDRVTLRRLP